MFKNLTLKSVKQFNKTSDEDMKLTLTIQIKSNHVIDTNVLTDIERQINMITLNTYEKKTQ